MNTSIFGSKKSIAGFLILLLISLPLGAAQGDESCEVVNLMPRFMEFWDSSKDLGVPDKVRRFRETEFQANKELYGTSVRLGADPEQLDDDLEAWFHLLEDDDNDLRRMSQMLGQELPKLEKRVRRLLPEFRCDVPVYFYFSAGAFDGALREVAGKQTLLFGVEVASRSQSPAELPAFIGHELFHVHHRVVTGAELDKTLYGRLWREGLATYFSRLLVGPDVSESAILGWPRDLADQVKPRMGEIVADVLESLDSTDENIMQKPLLGNMSGEYPPRYGYYIGYLIAQDISLRHSLDGMINLHGDELRAEMARALHRLAETDKAKLNESRGD